MVNQVLVDVKFYSTNMLQSSPIQKIPPFFTKFVLWHRTAKLRSAWRSTVGTTGNPHERLSRAERDIHNIVTKTNKLLGLLKRTCPLITDVNVRQTLYLSLAKFQLSYATQEWSPNQYSLKAKNEHVQRRAA